MTIIKKIKEELGKISKWPWSHISGEIITENIVVAQVMGDDDFPCLDEEDKIVSIECKANASFIAHSPERIALLVEYYEAMEEVPGSPLRCRAARAKLEAQDG